MRLGVFVALAIGLTVVGLVGACTPSAPSTTLEERLNYAASVINRANTDGTHWRAKVDGHDLVLARDRVVMGHMTEEAIARSVRPIACDFPDARKLLASGARFRFELTNIGLEPQPPAIISFCPDYAGA